MGANVLKIDLAKHIYYVHVQKYCSKWKMGKQVIAAWPKWRGNKISALLTKPPWVKMAGYWPSPLFCEFMNKDGVEVHKRVKRKRGRHPF